MNGGSTFYSSPEASEPFLAFPLTHLWFLYVLLWMYAATLAIRAMLVRLTRWSVLGTRIDAGMEWLVRTPWGLLIIAVPTWLGLMALPAWSPWLGIPSPDQSLLPNLAAIAAFGSAFAFGWLLHRQTELLQVFERRAHYYLVASIGITVACLWHAGLRVNTDVVALDATTRLYAAGYALGLWTWSFAFIGLALRYLSGFSATRRYIADASYWMYLAHLPLVLALQIVFSQLPWHWSIKLGLILAIATFVLLKTYRWWVRGTFIGAVLNGRRLPPA